MMELTTYTELEIAHRLMTSYAQKCRSLHGHRYEVEITVTAQNFNEDGMIVDFKKLKEVVKTELDDQWDHGACVRATDPLAYHLMSDAHHERVHIIEANPTLEWMVERWALDLQAALDIECPGVAVSMLKASETARNTVTWRCNCLPWERLKPVDDSQKPICAEKEKDTCRPLPIKYSSSVGVDVFTHTGDLEEDSSTPMTELEEVSEPIEDTALYLVQFRTGCLPYSTTVRTSHKGDALVDQCYEAARAFVTYAVKHSTEICEGENVVLLGITKLPG
jgi:6-pyruvoyltetrahydropterin/6-carboxytetrahydropterin synthase